MSRQKQIYLSDSQYINALKRLRVIINRDNKPTGFDSTDIGAKDTQCTWGLCRHDKVLWPEPKDYLWPEDVNRVVPKYRRSHHKCPLDQCFEAKSGGCFYTCAFFQKGRPVKAEVLKRIDQLIQELS
jgi:hypothetical protein